MVRTLNDHLVRAHARHAIVEAFTLAIKQYLDAQGRELVGHHAQIPLRSAVLAVGQNFRGRLMFLAGAERAEAICFWEGVGAGEVAWTPGPIGRDDHPTAGYRVLAQFWQSGSPSFLCGG